MKRDNNPFEEVYNYHNIIKDCLDVSAYPEANAALGHYMYDRAIQSGNEVFPLVCQNDGVYYCAIYMFIPISNKLLVERFILRPDFCLNKEDEERYYSYCADNLDCDPGMFESFLLQVNKVFPVMKNDKLVAEHNRIGLFLRHLYWCSLLNDVTPSQWQYTQCLLSDDGSSLAEPFHKNIYEYLRFRGNDEICEAYREFRNLRYQLNKANGIRISTPLPADLDHSIEYLNIALKYYNASFKWAEDFVNERNEQDYMGYASGEYIVLQPSINDVIEDAFIQHPNLLNSLDDYVNGCCRILLLRCTSSMNKPFTALVVYNRSIEYILGCKDKYPDLSVFKWLELYSRSMALKYRPDEILAGFEENLDGTEGYSDQEIFDLLSYANSFHEEHPSDE